MRRCTAPSGVAKTGPLRHRPRTWSGASRLSAMGLLDDAIRDHLDLKRRHGADPADVERAEREALGPVRRTPVERSDGELELGPPDQNEELYEDEYAPEERVSDHADWAD